MATVYVDKYPVSPRHKYLYKMKTPPLKEALRKRCYQRLKNCRQKLLHEFRNSSECYRECSPNKQKLSDIVEDVVANEWKELRTNSIYEQMPDDLTEDEVLQLMEEIQMELKEEQRLLLEREVESKMKEEAAFLTQVEWLEREEVVCPVCQRCALQQQSTVIYCNCGLLLSHQEERIGLAYLGNQLQNAMEAHNKNCYETATFSTASVSGRTKLVMSCMECGLLHSLL